MPPMVMLLPTTPRLSPDLRPLSTVDALSVARPVVMGTIAPPELADVLMILPPMILCRLSRRHAFEREGLAFRKRHLYDGRLDEHLRLEGIDLLHDPPDLTEVLGRRADEQAVRRRVGGDEDLLLRGLGLLALRQEGL
jgi:hypothetical protein